MMMMLGPEGAQLLGVTPAGADTATGGAAASLPSCPAPPRSRYVARSPRGGHITRGERKRWRENIYGDVQIVRRVWGDTVIKGAVTSRDLLHRGTWCPVWSGGGDWVSRGKDRDYGEY
jgi:hypothetical protein